MSTNPEFTKNAGCPYASLSTYYHKPAVVQNKAEKPVFAVPEFGSVGYNVAIAKAAAESTCHAWRDGSYDGRVLSQNAYSQCSPNSDCTAYASRY
jgi:hypothetical protein